MADATEPKVVIPNLCVNFGNGVDLIYIYDGVRYRANSKIDHPAFTKKIVELSGGIWNEQTANDYIRNINTVEYFDAVDLLREAGLSLQEAVELLTGEKAKQPEEDKDGTNDGTNNETNDGTNSNPTE